MRSRAFKSDFSADGGKLESRVVPAPMGLTQQILVNAYPSRVVLESATLVNPTTIEAHVLNTSSSPLLITALSTSHADTPPISSQTVIGFVAGITIPAGYERSIDLPFPTDGTCAQVDIYFGNLTDIKVGLTLGDTVHGQDAFLLSTTVNASGGI